MQKFTKTVFAAQRYFDQNIFKLELIHWSTTFMCEKIEPQRIKRQINSQTQNPHVLHFTWSYKTTTRQNCYGLGIIQTQKSSVCPPGSTDTEKTYLGTWYQADMTAAPKIHFQETIIIPTP